MTQLVDRLVMLDRRIQQHFNDVRIIDVFCLCRFPDILFSKDLELWLRGLNGRVYVVSSAQRLHALKLVLHDRLVNENDMDKNDISSLIRHAIDQRLYRFYGTVEILITVTIFAGT